MDINKAFFLRCLGDFLKGRDTVLQDGIDWELVYNFAIKHQMINIITYQCGNFMDEIAAANFEKRSKYALFYRMQKENVIDILKNVCIELGVQYAFLKGPVVAPFYRVPEYRTMGDIDIAVPTEDRPKMLCALLERGFSNESKNDEHEWVFTYKGVEVELHDKLIYKEVFNNEKQDAFLNDMWGYVKDGKMDASFHFIYLLHHLKKHLTSKGAGFRQFFDIACVAENCSGLDWDWISDRLKKLDMIDFANLCFALCKRWFDADIKAECPDIDDEFYEDATDKIFESGIFGIFDADNRFNMSVNRVNASGNRFFSYIFAVWKNIFPGYRAMSAMEQYSFLRGKPILLPAAWIYRVFWGMKNGKSRRFENKINSAFVPKDKIDKRMDELEKWKLN